MLSILAPADRMELTGMVDTPGLQPRRRPCDRAAAAPDGQAAPGHPAPCRGDHRQRQPDLPLLHYGISRQVFYKWRRRYDEHGLDGLRDRSHRPQVSPNATRTEVVGKIIYLRQHYHFGPAKIAMYLKRYHEIQLSSSGVWRILKRLGLNRLPASQRHKRHDRRWKRYEKPLPGHRVQLDVKFIAPLPGSRRKHYQFTAIDDCTRLRVLRIYDRCNQQPAIQFLDYVLAR